MFHMSDGDFHYADGLVDEEAALTHHDRNSRLMEEAKDLAMVAGSGAFWGWLSSYRGGLPEVVAGTGVTLDLVTGIGLHLVNFLGYGGEYEHILANVANGSITHFAIAWATKKGADMAAGSTTAGWQYDQVGQGSQVGSPYGAAAHAHVG